MEKHNQPFVVVEQDPVVMKILKSTAEALIVSGDATHDEILLEAGIDKAKSLITTLPIDSGNLFVVLSARSINNKLKIINGHLRIIQIKN